MSPVDQYIRRATTGLPSRTRLDTAAELRVHLNERIRQYMAQGFDRAEAEHLAVEQMGPAEPVNRSFLGHVFTPRVGWVVLALLVLVFGGWLAGNYLFAPKATVEERPVQAEELLPFIGDFRMLQLTLPKGTNALYLGTSIGEAGNAITGSNLVFQSSDLRPNQRITVPVGVGFLNSALATSECEAGHRVLVEFLGEGVRGEACVPTPSEAGSWVFLMQNEGEAAVVNDVWQPLLLFRPMVVVEELAPGQRSTMTTPDGYVVTAPRDTWIAFSMFAATGPLGEGEPQIDSIPKISDVVRQYRWLEF